MDKSVKIVSISKKRLQRILVTLAFISLFILILLRAPWPGILQAQVGYLRFLPEPLFNTHLGSPRYTYKYTSHEAYMLDVIYWPQSMNKITLRMNYEEHKGDMILKSIYCFDKPALHYYKWESPMFTNHPTFID